MSSQFLAVASIVVAGQGFLLMPIILSSGRRSSLADYLLAALTCVVAMRMLVFHLLTMGISYPQVFGPLSQIFFLGGPLLYLYTRALTDSEFHMQRRLLLHFLPAVLSTLATRWLYSAHSFGGGYPTELDQAAAHIQPFHKLIGAGFFAGYVAMALRLLPTCATGGTEIEPRTRRWLRELLWLSLGAALLVAAWGFYVLHSPAAGQALSESVEFIGNTLLLYLIATVGLRQHRATTAPSTIGATSSLPIAETRPAPAEENKSRYGRTSLSDERARELWNAVTEHMATQEPFLDCNLTLAELAEAIGSYPRELSQVLNTVGSQNFYDFVNGYRAIKARDLIRADRRGRAMVDIALAAGFTSRSMLYKYFSKCFSMTPAQWRKSEASQPAGGVDLGDRARRAAA
jgi:AraC-like DNA-binding protein